MKFFRDSVEENTPLYSNCIIWSLEGGKQGAGAIVLYDGQVKNTERKLLSEDYISYYTLSLEAVEEYLNHFPERSSTVLKYFDNNEE